MQSASWIARAVGKPWFWILVIAGVTAIPMKRAFLTKLPPMLPSHGVFPDFKLVDQNNRPFGADDLRGRVWLGAVLSPSAPGGPDLGRKMRAIQNRARALGASFRVVCITNSPLRDAPSDLDQFIRDQRGSPRMWSFLTGDPGEVDGLLRQVTGITGKSPEGRAWLVDPTMVVRAGYDLDDEGIIETVLRDVGLLANRGG